MTTDESPAESTPSPAGFWERFLAFVVDLFLVRALALIVFSAAMAGGVAIGPGPLTLLLLAAFVAYHAAWKGASPGARLLGLRAVAASGEPLTPAQGLKRALAWGLHDKFAGTRVVRLKPRGTLGMVAVYGACAALLLANAGIFAYRTVAAPEMHNAVMVDSARRMLGSLASLQEVYKSEAGSYTDDIVMVAGMANNPVVVMQGLPAVFEGGKVKIVLDGDGYTMSAKALDPARTPVSVQGPAK